MATDERDGQWPAVEAALERYFLARERGEAIDVKAACNGDVELAAKVLEVLGEAPDMVVEAAEPAPAQPTSFGDFDVVEQIGKGGMGTVYLALQRSLGREVALKVLDSGPKVMPSARVRMRREAELTALLDHPNIVPVYAVGEVGEVPFIAMKYLVGPTLADAKGPWSARRVAEVGKALAEALDAAHVQGVVHRDVKPANVIMDGNKPVFVDFGLARAQSDPTLTQEGKVAGTLRYMAPERLDSRSVALDPRVDIYGLGATLYELIAGHEVFGEQSPTALVRSVLVRDPAPLRLRGADHDLETVIMRALAKEPGRRFQSAREMADDLGRFLDGKPVASRPVSLLERGWRQMRRYPRVSAALVAATMLIVAALAFVLVQEWGSMADRDRRLASAQASLDNGLHGRAQEELATLVQRFPGDPEVEQALAAAESEVAIDRLMVLVADQVENIDFDELETLVGVGSGAGAERTGLLQLSAVVALGMRGDRGLARERLAVLVEPLRSSREAAVIAAWLEERPLPWTLPDAASERSPDLAVLATVVRRLAGEDASALLAELMDCTAVGPRGARHAFVEAVVMVDLGRFDVASALLRGLASEDAWPAVWRWLARAQLEMDQLDLAGHSLAMVSGDRSRNFEYMTLRHRLRKGGVRENMDAARRLADEVRSEGGTSAAAQQVLAELEGMIDASRVPASIDRLHALEERASNQMDRDLLVALQMKIAGWHLPSDFGEEHRAQHRTFVDQWRERSQRLGNSVTRSIAGLWLARSLVRSGASADLAEGMRLFAQIAKERPSDATVAVEFALTITSMPANSQPGAIMHGYTWAARGALENVSARVRNLTTQVSADARKEIDYYLFMLNWKLQDCLGIVETYPRARDLIPESFRGSAESAYTFAKELVDGFHGR